MLVRFGDVFDSPRPQTYQVRDGVIAVREAEETVSAAKKRANDAVKAAAEKGQDQQSAQEKRRATVEKNRKTAMKAALAQQKTTRQDRKRSARDAATMAKNSTSEKGVGGKSDKINAQLAHCMLALHFKRGKDARGAWNICRASLTKHGYMKGPYKEAGKAADVKPTQKGVRRAMQHAFEKKPLGGGITGSPAEKYGKFQKLFRDIEPTV